MKPLAREIDETGEFPRATFRKAAELGLDGRLFRKNRGRRGIRSHQLRHRHRRDFARLRIHRRNSLGPEFALLRDHSPASEPKSRKEKFLVPFARGERIGCYALTEPQAGSNAAALRTTAVRHGECYVVNGTKAWITNGGAADAAIVYVNTDPARGEKGITALLVERGTPGFRVGKEEKKMGLHATACTELSFSDCEVPAKNRLGAEGEGYKIALATLDGGRIGIAAQATGIAQGAFEQALAYAQQRQAFGKPIAEFQAIQFMLADMATEIDAARLMTRHAAWREDAGERFSMEASMAKLFASEMATRVCHKAIQIHGAYGYSREYPVERMYRDARVTEIYEGTSEIQRLVIASWVLRA